MALFHSELFDGVYFDGGDQQFISNNSEHVVVFHNNNSKLNIDVVEKEVPVNRTNHSRKIGEEPGNREDPSEKTYIDYIKFVSHKDFALNVSKTESGWAISKKSPCLFSSEPVILPMLPKTLNKWFKSMVLPAEMAWFLIKAPVALIVAFFRIPVEFIRRIFFSPTQPETTNVTVGDEVE